MNETLEETACLYVLDHLDRDERAAFETRLLTDPELAALVREIEAALARGVRSLPPCNPPASVLARIEERIGTRTGVAARRWAPLARWGIAAVIAVSLATLAVQSLLHSAARPMVVFVSLDGDRNTFADLSLPNRETDSAARFIQLAALAENFWEKPGALPVRSHSTPGDSHGYALFDPGSQQGFIAIEQLPALAENRHYHLWLVESATGRIRDGGVLPLEGTTRGLFSFALGNVVDQESGRPGIFVTVEETGAATQPDQPRGRVVLGPRPI